MKFSLIIPLAPGRNAEILKEIKKLSYPKKDFQVIVSRGLNPSLNRNKGIDNAKGELLVFLDDDAYINNDYLDSVENFFKKHGEIDVVGGPQLTPINDSWFGKISGYALGSKFGAWKLSNRYEINKENLDADEIALTSANLICRKKVVEKVRFDENLFPGEDPKFISDAKKNRFKIAYSPEIVVYHKRRSNFKDFVRQMFNYGKVRPKKENFFETLNKPFFLIPSIFFVYLFFLTGSVLVNPSIVKNIFNYNGLFNNVNSDNPDFLGEVKGFTDYVIYSDKNASINLGHLWFFPLIIYILLIILFGFYDSIKNKDLKAIFILPFIYPTIHLSYGFGMIWGWVRKIFK